MNRKYDDIKYPYHYNWIDGVQCEKIAGKFDFFLGNVFKYIYRSGKKKVNGLTMEESRVKDLKKAIEYMKKAYRSDYSDILGTIDENDLNEIRKCFPKRLYRVFHNIVNCSWKITSVYQTIISLLYAEIKYGKAKE